MADDIKERKKCYYCKLEGHFKRNCPKMKCFYCGENHQKNITDTRINKNIEAKEKTNTINKDKTSTEQKPKSMWAIGKKHMMKHKRNA